MKNTIGALMVQKDKEEKRRKRLLDSINRKREVLKNLIIKTEMLNASVEMAHQEYMAKVGNLFLKDNQMDLEIIRLQNILRLVKEGHSYDDAVKAISETYYNEQLELDREQEKAQKEEAIYRKREAKKTTPIEDIKLIWKRLIAKFHPDLVQDKTEKQRRHDIMKQVNKAYQEGDMDQLIRIEQDHLEDKETTVEALEEILISVMASIEDQKRKFKELKESEWYDWMHKIERGKKKNEDIFKDTERNLLDDIVAKIEILNRLRAEIRAKCPDAAL